MERFSSAQIPIFLLTGFLGSGKTSLLSGILRHPEMANTAVIINEVGEIGLDHFLVATSREDVILLEGGCLCCVVLDNLAEALASLYSQRVRKEIPRFERVVIETTGLAEPAPILRTLFGSFTVTKHFRLNGVIATVDAVLGSKQLERYGEAVRQVTAADCIVLTKTDLASPAAAAGVTGRIARLNPGVPVHRIWKDGLCDPYRLMPESPLARPERVEAVASWLREGEFEPPAAVIEPSPGHGEPGNAAFEAPHRHDSRIGTFSFRLDVPSSWAGYACWVERLRQLGGPRLLRMKGLLNIAECEGPVVVQAVQHVFHRLEPLPAWPTPDRRSCLTFITRDLGSREVEATLSALRAQPGSEPRTVLCRSTRATG